MLRRIGGRRVQSGSRRGDASTMKCAIEGMEPKMFALCLTVGRKSALCVPLPLLLHPSHLTLDLPLSQAATQTATARINGRRAPQPGPCCPAPPRALRALPRTRNPSTRTTHPCRQTIPSPITHIRHKLVRQIPTIQTSPPRPPCSHPPFSRPSSLHPPSAIACHSLLPQETHTNIHR